MDKNDLMKQVEQFQQRHQNRVTRTVITKYTAHDDKHHYLYRFDNQLGASVIAEIAREGQYEIAIIKWNGHEYNIINTNPYGEEVIRFLTEKDIYNYVHEISTWQNQENGIHIQTCKDVGQALNLCRCIKGDN